MVCYKGVGEMIKVTVWNEYLEERQYENVAKVYPKGIHGCIANRAGRV